MALSRGEVNPLGVLGLRKLSFTPGHFAKIALEGFLDLGMIESWIEYHLSGRYSIKKSFSVNSSNKMLEMVEIGFEDPKELTMLSLGCPYLHIK
jgi:hypothetical protein